MTDTKNRISIPVLASYALLIAALTSGMTAIATLDPSRSRQRQLLFLLAAALITSSLITALAALIKTAATGEPTKSRPHATGLALTNAMLLFFNLGFLGSTDFMQSLSCSINMYGLGTAFHVYSSDYDGRYPTADSWCDLLVTETEISLNVLCPSSDAIIGESSFALNKYIAETPAASIPSGVVVLFETSKGRAGDRDFPLTERKSAESFQDHIAPNHLDTMVYEHRFNQVGGLEAIEWNNHSHLGSHILFADGHSEWVPLEELPKLRWKPGKPPAIPENMAAAIAELNSSDRLVNAWIVVAIILIFTMATAFLYRGKEARANYKLGLMIAVLAAVIGAFLGSLAMALYYATSAESSHWGTINGTLLGFLTGMAYTAILSARSRNIPTKNIFSCAVSLGTLAGLSCSSLVHLTCMILATTSKPYALAFALPLGATAGAILGAVSGKVFSQEQNAQPNETS